MKPERGKKGGRPRKKNAAWNALPTFLFAGVLLAAIAVFLAAGERRARREAQAAMEPPPPPEIVTATERAAWTRLTDLERTTLKTELPLEVWLEYPVFLETGAGYQRINAFFADMRETFFSQNNEKLVRALANGTELTWTNTAAVDFSGALVTVTLDRGGEEEVYAFRADTGERVDLSQELGEEFTGPPWTPELEYRTSVSEDRRAGIRRTALDAQGLNFSAYFETPILEGDGPGVRAASEYFQALAGAFFSPENRTLAQAWEYAAYPGTDTDLWRYERPVQIRCETENLLSVSIGYEWYLGGVTDSGSDSYTFRLDTGAPLRLTQLVSERERELKAMILTAAEEQDAGTGEIDLERLGEYALDSFEFYVEDGEVYLAFDKYELAGGARGGFTLRIPATIREEFL